MSDRRQELWKMCEGWHTMKRCFSVGKNPIATFHLTTSQWLALEVVARGKQVSVKDIAEALSVTSSAATQIVNELLKHKHVTKKSDTKDARITLIALSPKTRQALVTMRSTMLRQMEKLFSTLSDREFAEYMRLHAKIIQAIPTTK